MAKVFKPTARDGKKSPYYYGKVKLAAKTWRRVQLFTDKEASKTKLIALQKEADQRAAGMQTAETDRLALPLKELVEQYVQSLRARNVDGNHVRITEWSLNKLVEAGKWQRFADITAKAVELLLPTLGDTASYQNAFIKKVKAFVHWAIPDNWPDPLKKLKRVREKGAKRTRARRPATDEEAIAFFGVWPKLPADRHLCYALAMLNGLRRSNIKRDDGNGCLAWGQVHLEATIPFLDLSQKMGDGQDYIPLHPYVVKLLRERMSGMPTAPLVRAVPDVETLEKDLALAGINMTDAQGKRLDFHGLRHSFVTALDRTGCSRATKKKLTRHAGEDVTDGYAHAELAEMLAALIRLPSPQSLPQQAMKTGTDNAPIVVSQSCEIADHQLDQHATVQGHSATSSDMQLKQSGLPCSDARSAYNVTTDIDLRQATRNDGDNFTQVIVNKELRPSTQVD